MKANPPPSFFSWKRHSHSGISTLRNRATRSFLQAVPWIDFCILAGLFYIFARDTVLQPGQLIELPQAPFEEGMLASQPTAILQYITLPGRQAYSVMLFDEGRYSSLNERELELMPEDFAEVSTLNLIVDGAITHADLTVWMQRLKLIGIAHINLVQKQ